jgi:hypothetical protein
MDIFVDILKITIPSIILLVAMCYLVGGFLRNSVKRQQLKIVKGNQKIIMPLRLQAYERLILFLERISPDSLVMRAIHTDKTCGLLHQELLQTIRAEYEHNLSQQLYVSTAAWENVRNAKNYTVSLINAAANGIEEETTAIELSRKLLNMTAEMEQAPNQKGIDALKTEVRQLF